MGFVFVLGACFGSFFNVCIYRIPRGVSLTLPPSHCYQCGQPIKWYDNIPMVSYLVLRGRCRYCSIGFSARYFFIELLTACLFLVVFVRYCNRADGYSWVVLPGVVFISMLLVATFTDIDHWIIPDRISLGGTGVGLALALIPVLGRADHNPLAEPLPFVSLPEWALPMINSAGGALVGFGSLWGIGYIGTLIFRKEAMGRGDMKLFAMIGAFLGPMNSVYVLVLASFLGSFAGGATLAWSKWGPKPAPDPSLAGLKPNAIHCEEMVRDHDLLPTEALVVTRALTSPGTVGPVRHHLPFGPSLAVAAAIVFLTWEALPEWFYSTVLRTEWYDLAALIY